jgi:hypothetical protein
MCIEVKNMTYEQLVDFLEHKMSVSHVYQPLLVRAPPPPACLIFQQYPVDARTTSRRGFTFLEGHLGANATVRRISRKTEINQVESGSIVFESASFLIKRGNSCAQTERQFGTQAGRSVSANMPPRLPVDRKAFVPWAEEPQIQRRSRSSTTSSFILPRSMTTLPSRDTSKLNISSELK